MNTGFEPIGMNKFNNLIYILTFNELSQLTLINSNLPKPHTQLILYVLLITHFLNFNQQKIMNFHYLIIILI
jgi:hypothetical protein